MAALQGGGKAVFLVSGGFRQVIHPIAQQLGIPLDHVYANQLLFKVGGWEVRCTESGLLCCRGSE